MKPYRWKLPPKPRPDDAVHRATAAVEGAALTGMVRGKEASDHEEYFANSLNRFDAPFEFQPSFIAGFNIPGEIRCDFILTLGQWQPVQIDGAIAHKSAAQREQDRVKDAILDERLSKEGASPTIRIDAEQYLSTQDESDAYVEEHFT